MSEPTTENPMTAQIAEYLTRLQERVEELEAEVKRKDEKIEQRDERIGELEERVRDLETRGKAAMRKWNHLTEDSLLSSRRQTRTVPSSHNRSIRPCPYSGSELGKNRQRPS